jgi:hypothetical protein
MFPSLSEKSVKFHKPKVSQIFVCFAKMKEIIFQKMVMSLCVPISFGHATIYAVCRRKEIKNIK